ncbi:MAG: hypothetical protein AB7N24_15660 [Dehalococcoidia bacterium]
MVDFARVRVVGWVVAVVGLAMASVVFGGSTAKGQDGTATLAFSPPPGAIGAGQHATYVLGIANATRLFGADIEISFDPKAVAIVDADPAKDGVQVKLGPFLDPGFVVYNLADNTTGKLRVTFTQVAPTAPATGSGALLSFEINAVAGGDPGLKVAAALLARDDGTEQPVTIPVSGGEKPAQPQGSPAPNPTQIPAASETASTSPTVPPGSPAAATGTALLLTESTPSQNVGGVSGTGGKPPEDSNDSRLWWGLLGAGVVTGGAVVVGRKYLKRNGETT